MEGLGLSGATKRVAEHAREFVRLEVELATAELKKKAAALGTGIGLMVAAAVLAFLALTFGLLAAAAGLATTLPVWASLLIVCGGARADHRSPHLRRLSDAAEGREADAGAGGRGSSTRGGGVAQWRRSLIFGARSPTSGES